MAHSTPKSSYAKVSLVQRLGLGLGGVSDMGMQYAILTMASPIFNLCMGVNPAIIGIALSLPRFWEMIFDPWIGGLSDRVRSPLGRRHPFILLGGILGGIVFAAVWWVPQGWSSGQKGAWLIVMSLVHFTAFSIFMVPYSALLAEVSPNALERTRIMASRTGFAALASCAIGWLYWLCQRPCFANPVVGMRVVGIIFGCIMSVAAIMPVFVCKRTRLYQPPEPGAATPRELAVIGEILKIPEFRYIILAVLSLLTSFTLVSNLSFYINVYYVFGGNTAAAATLHGIASMAVCGTSLLTCSVISHFSKKFGRKQTLTAFLLLTLAGKISSWWTYSPEWPYATIASAVLINMGITAFWIFMPALIGEISNHHEARTGRSLYGSFCALYGVSLKIAASLALLLTGFLLNFTKFDAALGKAQSVATITDMRLYNVALPAVGLLLAMACLSRVWPSADKPRVSQ